MYGNLNVAKWLCKIRGETLSPNLIEITVRNGHIEMVRWMTEHCAFAECTPDAMDTAAGAGDLRMVRYLHESRSEGCTTKVMDAAAGGGHFQVVLYLHANRSEGCTSLAFTQAFLSGHLEILRWLVFNYPHLYDPNSFSTQSDAAPRNLSPAGSSTAVFLFGFRTPTPAIEVVVSAKM